MSEKMIRRVVWEMEHCGVEDQRRAARALVLLAEKGEDISSAVPNLIAAIDNSDKNIRWSAIWALGLACEKGADISSALPALARALVEDNPNIIEKATNAFKIACVKGANPSRAMAILIELLENENYAVNCNGILALKNLSMGGSDISAAFPALLRLLADDHPLVRESAATLLKNAKPSGYADLKMVAYAAREAKKEGEPVDILAQIYSEWTRKMKERASNLFSDKRFRVPKIEPEKTERVLRVKRLGA